MTDRPTTKEWYTMQDMTVGEHSRHRYIKRDAITARNSIPRVLLDGARVVLLGIFAPDILLKAERNMTRGPMDERA